jgi:hypothetical protein
MGSGMTEGCIWLSSARRMGPVIGSILWSRKCRRHCREGGCLLAVLVGSGGGTGVKIGRVRSGTMSTAVHRRRLLVIRRRPGSV